MWSINRIENCSKKKNIMMAQPASSCPRVNEFIQEIPLSIPSKHVRKTLSFLVIAKPCNFSNVRPDPEPQKIQCKDTISAPHYLSTHSALRVISDTKVASFTGYHCSLTSNIEKWDTYNVKSYAQPPSKEVT